MTDVVAVWSVSLSDGIHKVQFEHGTTSGKRVIYVDNKEISRKNWMFKLVGREVFSISGTRAVINIDACSGFAYEYQLEVGGKSLEKFVEQRSRTCKVWTPTIDGVGHRIVLEKDSMDVWCDGCVLETAGEFVDDGTETHFELGGHACCIKAVSSGKRREGIVHSLIIDDREVPQTME
ncbi:fas apoptotic inhibitory molecule 1-like isoform X2 [Lytechinus pictus]|uniref:fas apoptotic inhibitory molecule 1-like isoform X2 n=1 Tax=Lytechinus pictus TaxID=7653 RepID=UPI00240E32AA|nr:fas apoptotic inhibitory molecule 1-like [Lytechinus pictus]XP_054751957.1 fas apoptotic inhibitory molecule 1-like [Lytechinus pictus]